MILTFEITYKYIIAKKISPSNFKACVRLVVFDEDFDLHAVNCNLNYEFNMCK